MVDVGHLSLIKSSLFEDGASLVLRVGLLMSYILRVAIAVAIAAHNRKKKLESCQAGDPSCDVGRINGMGAAEARIVA
jgi:hypothetical protein